MEKDPKTAEIQPVSESNFQIMKFRLHHSLLAGEIPLSSVGISAAC